MKQRSWVRMDRGVVAAAVVWCCVGLVFSAQSVSAATWYVATSGSDANTGVDWANAFLTISNGVANAPDGSEVVVSNGIYQLSTNIVITNAITVRGASTNPADTVVKGPNTNGAVYYRCFLISNAAAVVSNFTITLGYGVQGAGVNLRAGTLANCLVVSNYMHTEQNDEGVGIYMAAGTVSNCVITRNIGPTRENANMGPKGGGIFMTGGYVVNSEISYNRSAHPLYDDGDNGAGVCMYGGTVDVCRVIGNIGITTHFGLRGGGMFVSGAGSVVRNSTIVGNLCRADGLGLKKTHYGGGIFLQGGLVESCVISNNTVSGGLNADTDGGGGVYMNSGTLRNCLIVSNSAPAMQGGGVYISGGGNIANCTLSANASDNAGAGIYMSGGTVSNSSIRYNYRSIVEDNVNKQGGTVTYSAMSPLVTGTGNTNSDPLFINAAGDYRLGPGSPCINTGSNAAWMNSPTKDLDGINARIIATTVDMGCYEDDPAGGTYRCAFSAPTVRAYSLLDAVFTAAVSGPDTNGTAYYWDFDGNGTTDLSGADRRIVTNTYASTTNRYYTVALTVSNTALQTAVMTRVNYVELLVSPTTYVATNGAGLYPYDTWSKAATNVKDAVNAAFVDGINPVVVLVSNGVYVLTAAVTVDKALTLRGVNGLANTWLGYTSHVDRVLNLNSSNAVVEGLTLSGGYTVGYGGGLYLQAGTVTNCRVDHCWATSRGGGVYMTGGTLRNCQIVTNEVYNRNDSYGGGIWMSAGQVLDCVISGNVAGEGAGGGPHVYAGGIWMQGGLVRNSLVVSNLVYSTGYGLGDLTSVYGGGIYMNGGTVENVTVVTNQLQRDHLGAGVANGAGIFRNAGTVTNAIIYDNRATTNASVGGIYPSNNWFNYHTDTNNPYWFATNVNGVAGFAYSCAPELTSGAGNLTNDPLFRRLGSNDFYRLRMGSPCINAGTNQNWMTDAVDLLGGVRIQNRSVDMGAFESPLSPLGTLFVVH